MNEPKQPPPPLNSICSKASRMTAQARAVPLGCVCGAAVLQMAGESVNQFQ